MCLLFDEGDLIGEGGAQSGTKADGRLGFHTILFISLRTSSSLSGRDIVDKRVYGKETGLGRGD